MSRAFVLIVALVAEVVVTVQGQMDLHHGTSHYGASLHGGSRFGVSLQSASKTRSSSHGTSRPSTQVVHGSSQRSPSTFGVPLPIISQQKTSTHGSSRPQVSHQGMSHHRVSQHGGSQQRVSPVAPSQRKTPEYRFGGAHQRPGNSGQRLPTTYDYEHLPAQYGFSYTVQDPSSGNDFGHSESRDGDLAQGVYFVQLPDGRRQTVEYFADEYGYHPTITYEGTAQYPGTDAAASRKRRPGSQFP
ncbi:uncharacterized protein LOC143035724 [Oratosquilla oratoria]|uniref:uncharacterized protein LOC143035724 n=1 Tax=Oratosquilla oratoria TaxID=337810 RepID=UPI003F76E46C